MQLPALAIGQPDLSKTLASVASIKNAQIQNKLLEYKMGREKTLTGIRSKLFDSDTTPDTTAALEAGGGPTPQAASMMDSPQQGMKFNTDVMKRYLAAAPEEATKVLGAIEKMNEGERKKAEHDAKIAVGLAYGVLSAPPEQQPMMYAQALAEAERRGLDISGVPRTFTPQAVHKLLMRSAATLQYAEAVDKIKPKAADMVKIQTAKGPKFVEASEAAGKQAYEKPTALTEKIGILSKNMPKEVAEGIAAGRYTTSRDPINQTVQVVDKATGQIVFDGSAQPGPSATASDKSPANVPPGTDMSSGTGASGFFGNIANTITDAFGQGLAYPQSEKAAQALKNLKVRTQTAMQASVPGRPSKYLMEQLGELSVTPNSLLQGEARSKERLRQTRDMLQEEVTRMERDILANPEGFTPKQVANTRANVSQLKSILQNYDAVVENFDKKGAGEVPPPDQRVPGETYQTPKGPHIWLGDGWVPAE